MNSKGCTVKTQVSMAYLTFPNQDLAKQISHQLVAEQLVACVNIISSVKSIYQWEGRVCEQEETLVWMKLAKQNIDKVKAFIAKDHPYELPGLVFFDIKQGLEPYLNWIRS